jgi:putative transposase
MPRRRVPCTADVVFHVINRGIRRARLFATPDDYRTFVLLLQEAVERVPIRLLAYCVMPNHFHLVLWPSADDQLSRFMWWLCTTHSKRWHVWRGSAGLGPVYQGRFRAFPVQTDSHFLTVCRYVERNALRAGLVTKAEDWSWSSLDQRRRGTNTVTLAEWPVERPDDWLELVNDREAAVDVETIRAALRGDKPFGSVSWTESMANRCGQAPQEKLALNLARAGRGFE